MKSIITLFFLCLVNITHGTHLRAGYISAKPISCFEYEITIRIFTDTSSPIKFGDGELRFGDGSSPLITPELANSPLPGQLNVGFVEYKINHTYPSPGAYIISYIEANRNEGIINLANSVNTLFHIQTNLIIDPLVGCFQTPVLLTPATFNASIGDTLSLSFAASSDEDFIFRYELVNPLNAISYVFPENAFINDFNGLFIWDTKFNEFPLAGEFLFAVKISYWTKVGDIYKFVGHTIVDTQIILEDFEQSASITTSKDFGDYGRVHLPVGGTETIKIIYKGIDNENIELNAYTDLVDTPEAFSFTTYDSGTNIKVGILTLNSLQVIDREEPYVITVRGIESPQYFPSDINFMLFTRDVFPPIITNVREDLDWSVYPNPSTDILNFNFPANIPVFINILNLQGNKIGNWGNTKTIDTSTWLKGHYLVEIIHPNGKKVFKVVKQ